MIYFVTCGRGFEKFAKEEVQSLEDVCAATIIGEGKLVFCQCSVKMLRTIRGENDFNNCLADIKKIHTITQEFYSFSENGFSKAPLLFQLKLVEKLYILIYIKVIQDFERNDDCGKLTTELLSLSYSDLMEVMTQLRQLNHALRVPWRQCLDPVTCTAFASREESNAKKFAKKRKFCDEECHAMKNQQKKLLNKIHELEVQQAVVPFSQEQNTFRVSCRIRGSWKKIFRPFSLSKTIADKIIECNESWTYVNDKPILDIYINLNDRCIIAAASVSDKPLSLRPYIPHITLRSTICHLMIKEARIAKGSTVYDPMCGAGTILLEAATNIQNIRVIASDIDPGQLRAAQCNLREIENVEYILSDVKSLPLRSDCVDAVVCDFPFGKKHVVECYETLLPTLLKECIRILRRKARLVLLLSAPQQQFLNDVSTKFQNVSIVDCHSISLGVTPAYVCTLEVLSKDYGINLAVP